MPARSVYATGSRASAHDAGGDAQLRLCHHRRVGRRLGDQRQGRKTSRRRRWRAATQLIALLKDEHPTRSLTSLAAARGDGGARQPWGVQLSDRLCAPARARRPRPSLETRYRARYWRGRDPTIIGLRELRSRGTRAFYQMRVGAPTRVRQPRACARACAAPARPAWCCAIHAS